MRTFRRDLNSDRWIQSPDGTNIGQNHAINLSNTGFATSTEAK